MFNFISHRAEILVSLFFAVRADINQMPKVSQQYPFLSTEKDNTFLIILAVLNNADFWTWESQRPSSFAIIWQFRLLTSCISWYFLFITWSCISWYCHVYNHCHFIYVINYYNIWSSGFYHVVTLDKKLFTLWPLFMDGVQLPPG